MIDHLQAAKVGCLAVQLFTRDGRSASSWSWSHKSSLARTMPAFGCQGPSFASVVLVVLVLLRRLPAMARHSCAPSGPAVKVMRRVV